VRLLLDTHTFLWLMAQPDKLSAAAVAACDDLGNDLVLSVASLWEIQVKQQLGKLRFDVPLAEIVQEQSDEQVVTLLPIQAHHVLALDALPPHHKDPFDRLLIAQAHSEQLTLVSGDAALQAYADLVAILW
jgi:PIN domain nuclease of toxin-antitoxin system